MRTTMKSLVAVRKELVEAHAELNRLKTLPYYDKYNRHAEKERDISRLRKRIERLLNRERNALTSLRDWADEEIRQNATARIDVFSTDLQTAN